VAFEYFRRGESLEQVAKQLGRATSTVAGYLQDYLRHEKIKDCTPWVDAATRDLIISQLDQFEGNRLTPIFEHFEGKISYDTLRIAITCHKNSQQTA
jgi:ATP-dependent DNA helicase RecQ